MLIFFFILKFFDALYEGDSISSGYLRLAIKQGLFLKLSIAFILDHLCLFSDQLVPSIRPASARY